MKTKKLITGTLVGALTMMLWGATEWLNPLLQIPYRTIANPSETHELLNEKVVENGLYVWPNGPDTKNADRKVSDIMYFMVKNDASYYNPSRFMSVQMVNQILIWLCITYLLLWTKIKNHWGRVLFVVILATISSLTFLMPMWNWWGFPTSYVLIRWLNMLFGWLLAANVVSYVLRKEFVTSKNELSWH